jgi:hypothetical protein
MNATTKINVSRSWLAKGVKSVSVPFASCALLLGAVTAHAQTTNVNVDPTQNWIGYVNVFELPSNGGAYDFGSVWATGALTAYFSDGALFIIPNTNLWETTDTYYVQADGVTPNKIIDANMYVQNDALAGLTVTFSGNCEANSMVSSYSCSAFVKDFNAGYALVSSSTNILVGGTTFSLTLATTPGDHIQFGFETIGPDANPATVSSLGEAQIAEAATTNLAITPLSPVALVGTSESLNVIATANGLNYQWRENGVNLTNNASVSGATTATLTLSNIQGSAEGTYTAVVYNNGGTNTVSTYLTVLNPAHLTLDPHAPWIGYENYYYDNGGQEDGFLAGNEEPPAHLPAGFDGAILTMTPNTSDYDPTNDEFVNPDGSAAAIIEADFYVQDDALAGLPLTFVGYCPSNSLVTPYTSTVFIEDFSPGYGLNGSVYSNLVAGQPFSVSLTTLSGDHIEYGFQTVGPVANPTNVAALGLAQASINPPSMTASVAGSVVSLRFPTESGLQYSVLYKTNLTSSTWQTLSTVNGTAATVTVTDSTGPAQRFYRLSIQ